MIDVDVETKFRHLNIFPGVVLPLTLDARDEIFIAAANGAVNGGSAYLAGYETIQPLLNRLVDDGLFPYLAELVQLPADASARQVEAELFAARAQKLGLSPDTPRDEILGAERRLNRCLTIGELRTARDKRNGTYVPLVNDGQW